MRPALAVVLVGFVVSFEVTVDESTVRPWEDEACVCSDGIADGGGFCRSSASLISFIAATASVRYGAGERERRGATTSSPSSARFGKRNRMGSAVSMIAIPWRYLTIRRNSGACLRSRRLSDIGRAHV